LANIQSFYANEAVELARFILYMYHVAPHLMCTIGIWKAGETEFYFKRI